jgi:hypothetical protein
MPEAFLANALDNSNMSLVSVVNLIVSGDAHHTQDGPGSLPMGSSMIISVRCKGNKTRVPWEPLIIKIPTSVHVHELLYFN